MHHGTVKWYSESRGKGIIIGDRADDEAAANELSVSHQAIVSPGFKILYEGQRVSFEIVQTAKGPAASRVMACGDED
jgi:cold shock protein